MIGVAGINAQGPVMVEHKTDLGPVLHQEHAQEMNQKHVVVIPKVVKVTGLVFSKI